MPKFIGTNSTSVRTPPINMTTNHGEQSLGPNLRSRLEALEAAMGVRLNVAKRQGRQSLSNTSSSSPMQISPTSITSTAGTSTTMTSLSTSSRQNVPSRIGQGVQRSASSCDVENRPGPIKRLKPSTMVEQSAPSGVTAVATLKKYPPSVRRALATSSSITNSSSTTVNSIPTNSNAINSASTNASVRPSQSKQPTVTKPRSSPMETSSARSSRSSMTNNASSSISSNNRNSHNSSPKITTRSSVKQRTTYVSPPPPVVRPATLPRKQRQSVFGEQFSDDMLKTNLLWINLNELDDDARTEVLIQFGTIERFLNEQRLFVAQQQQQQIKLTTGNKVRANRSRLERLTTKKDRLELL